MKRIYAYGLYLLIILGIACSTASAQVNWMPDSNLRQAVRETLGLSDNTLFTQQDMEQLTGLEANDSQIIDLTGLEHAINLIWLSLGRNEIRDLHPLAELPQLEALYIWGNPISNLSPLAKLTTLKTLHMQACSISDLQRIGLTGYEMPKAIEFQQAYMKRFSLILHTQWCRI